MSAILAALHDLSEDDTKPVQEQAIAARLRLSVKTVQYYLSGMERLSLVRRVGSRGAVQGWLLDKPKSPPIL